MSYRITNGPTDPDCGDPVSAEGETITEALHNLVQGFGLEDDFEWFELRLLETLGEALKDWDEVPYGRASAKYIDMDPNENFVLTIEEIE